MNDGGPSQEDIGRRLVHLRESLNLRQTGFAQRTGIAQNTLANYEAGLRRPRLDEALKIVAATNVTLDWIYLGVRSGLTEQLLPVLPPLPQPPPRRERQKTG